MENTQQPQVPAQGTNQPSGSGKKTLWIVLGVVLLLLIVGGFVIKKVISAVGNKVLETAIERGTGDDADVNLKNGEVTVKTDTGSVTYGNTKLPNDWPSDVPIYQNSQITFAASSTGAGNEKFVASVQFATEDSAEKLISYYRNELPARGWKITGTQTAAEAENASTIIVGEKDTRAIGVQIIFEESIGVSVTVTVGTK